MWKYPLTAWESGQFGIEMPDGAELLTLQVQHGVPTLWARVNEARAKVRRMFIVVGTGHDAGSPNNKYVGTFQVHDGALIFHVFEVPR